MKTAYLSSCKNHEKSWYLEKAALGNYKDIIFSVKIMAPHHSCGKILHLDGVYLIFH